MFKKDLMVRHIPIQAENIMRWCILGKNQLSHYYSDVIDQQELSSFYNHIFLDRRLLNIEHFTKVPKI